MELCYASHAICRVRCLVQAPIPASLACPDCGIAYAHSSTRFDALPTPFCDQMKARNCVVIKPSVGFFQTYNLGDDLHIGLADSNGTVHSFWTDGIVAEPSSWDKSIVVCTLDADGLDERIGQFIYENNCRFRVETYRPVEWNCFDFVIDFMHSLHPGIARLTKGEFVIRYVQKPLKLAIRYCKLWNEVQRRGCITIK